MDEVDANSGAPRARAKEGEFIPGMATGRRRGRKPHRPTDESRRLVENLSGIGVPQKDIARVVRVNAETLRELYADELAQGHAKAVAEIAKIAFQEAKKGGAAMMFWLRCRAGWSEGPQQVQLTGKDGEPLQQPAGAVLMVPMPLSESEWEKQVSARQAALLAQKPVDPAGE